MTSSSPYDDYTVIYFQNEPSEYNPEEHNLHITLLPLVRVPFALDSIAAELAEQVKNIADATMSFTMTAGEKAWFRPDNSLEVVLLSNADGKHMKLHHQLTEVFNRYNAESLYPEYTGVGFNPHMTASEANIGEEFLVDRITLIRSHAGFQSGHGIQTWTYPLK